MARRPDRPPIGAAIRSNSGRGSSSTPGGSRSVRGDGDQAGVSRGFTRPALAPSLLAAVVLLACIALIDSGAFLFVRMGVTVLALIVLVFAFRGRSWVSMALTAAIAVLWNPVLAVPIPGELWAALQVIASVAFIVVGILVRVPLSEP